MSKSIKIGFDLDGVIIDYTSSKLYKAKTAGYNLLPYETPSDIIKTKMPRDHYDELQKYIYGTASLKAPAQEDALKYISRLAKTHNLFIISRRKIEDGGDKLALKWLQKNKVLDYIPKERIFFVPHSDLNAKDKVAKNIGIDVFVDDELKILKKMPSVKKCILFDQYDISSPPRPYLKIKKWRELPRILKI